MKLKALSLILAVSTVGCSVLAGAGRSTPTPSAAGFPTYHLVLPTETVPPPTVALPTFDLHLPSATPTLPPPPSPTFTETATPLVKWPIATLQIISSLPMTGPEASTAEAFVKAERLRLAQAKSLACGGKYALVLQSWDDGSSQPAGWDPRQEVENAGAAANTPSVIAYIGGLESDASKIAIPILEAAGPLVMVSPSSTYPGLTKPVLGNPDEPDKYYPHAIRNFVRVVGSDDLQGSISAGFLSQQLGVKSVFILDDGEQYSRIIADVFEAYARLLGMAIAGHETVDPLTQTYVPLMFRIATSNSGAPPDAIFASVRTGNSAGRLLQDKLTVLGDNTRVRFMGPGDMATQAFIDDAGPSVAEGVYAAKPGLPYPDSLTGLGKQFVNDYEARYGPLTEPAALQAYESMNVVLKAIEDVCAAGGDPTDRRQVRDAVFALHTFSGVLGTWTFDQNGDTTLTGITIFQVKHGSYEVVGEYR